MTFALKVADIVIRVESEVAAECFRDFGFYRDFLVPAGIPYRCLLHHAVSAPPDCVVTGVPFSTQNWQLSPCSGGSVLRVGPEPKRGKADNVVVFNADFSEGWMYQKDVFELFRRFIDQFLLMNLLSQRKGFLLHASGVIWKRKGICFAGPSGAGKSTLLNLFKDEVGAGCLLNDDRLALRGYTRKWRVFGTPWYGESRVSSPGSAVLSALFLIRHSRANYLRRLSAPEICPRLMSLGLLPLWDGQSVARVLSAFQDLIRDVPVFEMGFLPDKRCLGLIKKVL